MVDLKRLRGLAANIYKELFRDLQNAHPSLKKELARDVETLECRLESEGMPFLTQTLARLGASVLDALQTGQLTVPSSFARRRKSALPRFLGGLLGLCFTNDGALKIDVDPLDLADVLQVTDMAKKLSLPYTAKQKEKVLNNFKQTEAELTHLVIPDDMVIKRARATITAIFKDFDPMDIKPRHGPGSVASGEKAEGKWTFSAHYEQIHSTYPYYEYFVPCRGSLLTKGGVKGYKKRVRCLSGCAKVCLVDKDSRGPRLISLEPLEYQYIQQGLARAMMAHLEKFHLTSGRVNFTDQSVNRQAALDGSYDQSIATLDMKEASDRISLQLVEKLFSGVPQLLKCLYATRTPRTKLPDGEIVTMRKFAPMGSALCFPVESVVFFALCKAIIETNGGKSDQLRVYGDDLIVPGDVALSTMARLPIYGLKVNVDKSFTKGFFRESCGMDAFKGVQITPTRWRKPWPRSRHDGEFIAALVDFSNRLYKCGYWSTSSFLEKKLSSFIPTIRHIGLANQAGAIGFTRVTAKTVVDVGRKTHRWNSELHRVEIYATQLETKVRKTRLGQWPRLHSNLLEQFTSSYPEYNTAGRLRGRWLCYDSLFENVVAA